MKDTLLVAKVSQTLDIFVKWVCNSSYAFNISQTVTAKNKQTYKQI